MAVQEYKDGFYEYNLVKDAICEDFVSEKEMCEFIEANIKEFALECLGVEYKSHKREFQIGHKSQKGNRRVDFVIFSKCNQAFIVECKDPTYKSELTAAIGQVLGYMTMIEIVEGKMLKAFIVSTKIDAMLPSIISRFNLPIGFICIDKSKSLVLQNGRK